MNVHFLKIYKTIIATVSISIFLPLGLYADQNVAEPAHHEIRSTPPMLHKAWTSFASLLREDKQASSFLPDWVVSEQLFASSGSFNNTQPMAAEDAEAEESIQFGGAESIIQTYYNPTAAQHISAHQLAAKDTLQQLRSTGPVDPLVPENRSIPSFPVGSAVVLTAWWPLAANGLTPVPVWDPDANSPLPLGNGYASWPRVVAATAENNVRGPISINFLGRHFSDSEKVRLDQFRFHPLDDDMSTLLMRDPAKRKAALIALNRPLAEDDFLALVAANLAIKQPEGWLWIALWWHDQPQKGLFAAGRPANLPQPWENYLLAATSDEVNPRTPNGEPNITFNPWLEARFRDSGSGGGMVSNCANCHNRASFPPVSFLPIQRGMPDLKNDPAFSVNRLRTDSIWAIARQAH